MNMKVGSIMMAAALVTVGAQADSFGTGGNAFTLDFVNIGYAGNAGDTANTVNAANPGAVADSYRMGMHEVTIDQFTKAQAADSRIGNGNKNPNSIGVNGPASFINWYESAKFANWLTTGDAYTGAYQFDGAGTLTNINRAAAVGTYGTVYVLPTDDEWYKAAYLKSDGTGYTTYATGNLIPGVETDANYGTGGTYTTPWDVGTGTVENNGTFDMGGNVWEWNESAFDGTLTTMDESRVIRGGAFANESEIYLQSSYRIEFDPTLVYDAVGFRVAAIPEPSSLAMVGVACGLGLFIRRRFRR